MSASYFEWEPEIEFIEGGPDAPPPRRVIDLVEASESDNPKLWPFLGEVAIDTFFSYKSSNRTVEMQVRGIGEGGLPIVGGRVIKDDGDYDFSGLLLGYLFPDTNETIEGLLRVGYSPVLGEQENIRTLPRQMTRPYIQNRRSAQRF